MVTGNSWWACRKVDASGLSEAWKHIMVLPGAAVHSAASCMRPDGTGAIKGGGMKAWQLERLGGELPFNNLRTPEPPPCSAVVLIAASALVAYLQAYRG